MRRILVAGFAAVFMLSSGPAQADVTHFDLDNGMDVVVIEDHRAPVAVHMVWYRVGAADEPPGKSGIAHFLEHLMFKGTETRAPGEFSDIVEAQGGRDNAFTSWDYTGYFQRVAADRLDLMMVLEADRMRNLAFTEAEWMPERDVILEERGQVVESRPGRLFGEQMHATLYQNHPYGTPIIGWRHEMEGLTGADAMAFYDRYYRPENAVLVVAGAVSPQEVRELAQTYYGTIPPAGTTPESRPQEPGALSDRRVEMSDPRVAQPYLMRYFHAPSRRPDDQDDAAALQVLAQVLGGSSSTSVLARALQFEDRIALQTNAFYSPTSRDSSTFGLVVVPMDGVALDEAEAEMERVIEAFLAEGVAPEDLERAKLQLRASDIYRRDSTQSRAREYGTALSVGLGVEDVARWPERIDAVEADDVLAAARRVFDGFHVTGFLTGADADEETDQ